MKRAIVVLFFCFIVLLLLPLSAYLFIFASPPRDLGVRYSESDRISAYTNNGVESEAISPTAKNKSGISYEGKKETKTSFTSQEITALNNSVKWINYPISNLQIKINQDGTGEVSGSLDIRKILTWVSFTHPIEEIESKIKQYNIGFTPAIYLKGGVKVINNKVSLTPQTIEVGRITIPKNIVSENIPAVEKFVQERILSVPNLSIRSLNLDGGKVNFDATVPEKELTVQ
ncbi:hypothetical protein HYV64_01365 [Candidatus Shapirobacteria bacterium]|nr:hypothetical protein [Candidatus Shapirobacteria bacterium]